MVGGPARRCRLHAAETQFGEIEHVDERIDHANTIALIDPVIEAFRQQRRLPAIRPCNEALHQIPPQIAWRIIAPYAFSRSQGQKRTFERVLGMSALPPVADITGQAKAVRAELPRLWLDRLLCSLGTDSAGCSTGWLKHGALSHARHYCA